jgi:hypothetical protein
MLCDVATWADTSSNQAIKDLGQRRCGYSNLGKLLVIKSSVVARTLPTRAKSGSVRGLHTCISLRQKRLCF